MTTPLSPGPIIKWNNKKPNEATQITFFLHKIMMTNFYLQYVGSVNFKMWAVGGSKNIKEIFNFYRSCAQHFSSERQNCTLNHCFSKAVFSFKIQYTRTIMNYNFLDQYLVNLIR